MTATVTSEIERQRRRMEEQSRRIDHFRDNFYTSVRRALGEARGDIGVVRHRFVVQADVLFEPFSDEMPRMGKSALQAICAALSRVTGRMPDDLQRGWTLQIDVHSCRSDVMQPKFPDKMRQTEAQAIVLKGVFAENGVAPNKLVVNAYGDLAPMDNRDDEKAMRKNRRVEIRLADPGHPIHPDEVDPAEPKKELGWTSINPTVPGADRVSDRDADRPKRGDLPKTLMEEAEENAAIAAETAEKKPTTGVEETGREAHPALARYESFSGGVVRFTPQIIAAEDEDDRLNRAKPNARGKAKSAPAQDDWLARSQRAAADKDQKRANKEKRDWMMST